MLHTPVLKMVNAIFSWLDTPVKVGLCGPTLSFLGLLIPLFRIDLPSCLVEYDRRAFELNFLEFFL
jgi:hypothetical protein